jgi:cobalt-zinc-cadmium efflux system protein
MNTRAARLHVLGDVLGSAAALISGAAIAATGWTPIDALASLAICLLIAASAARLMRESLHALMEGVPQGLSVEAIATEMARVDGVVSVHDLHVWTLSGSRIALSAHVVVRSMSDWHRMLGDLQHRLHDAFGIDHVTLQPESTTRPLVRH